MRAFGSKKNYAEWRFTRRTSGKAKIHRDGWLNIKSHKLGRHWNLALELSASVE